MDNTKVITCRTHGGTFRVPIKRGRPPVNCTPENKCRKPKQTVGAVAPRTMERARADSAAIRGTTGKAEVPAKPAEAAPVPPQQQSPGVRKAFQAKAQLEALGWECKGSKAEGKAVLTATRGVELLVVTWDLMEGKVITQDYTLWDTTVGTGRNGKPPSKLTFDPEETPDAELVRELSGMKVTWWNSLAQAETSDVVQPGTIKVEHSYESNGDEVYGDRIVKFIGYGGGGFRAFRLAALMKVG